MPHRPALNEGRSLNPGDTCSCSCAALHSAPALNEGRSLNPGDTKTTPVVTL